MVDYREHVPYCTLDAMKIISVKSKTMGIRLQYK